MKQPRKQPTPYWLLGLFAALVGNRMVWLYQSASGTWLNRLTASTGVFLDLLQRPLFISTAPGPVLGALCGVSAAVLCYIYFIAGAHRTRPGQEHGSADWGTKQDISPLMDKDPANNVILTETEGLSMNSRLPVTKDDDYNRNKNVMGIGGSGTGKSRYLMKPNLLQRNCNYVVTDPKGALLEECGYALASDEYTIKILDLVHMDRSDHFNPFVYMHNEDDIVKVAKNFLSNLKADPRAHTASDPLWEEGMTGLLEALMSYVLFELRPEDQNMNSLMELFRMTQVKENIADYMSPLDVLFQQLKEKNPEAFAARQYDIYKMAAPKTAESINVSLGMRLAPFNIPSVRNLVQDDTLNLLDFAEDKKVALFIITPDTTKAYNFLAAVLYQQMFDLLIRAADNLPAKRLPRHCRLLMDEFANIGQIPDFENIISVIRSREISVTLMLQSISQLQSMYEKDWKTIADNCDSLLYLGGTKTTENLRFISEMLGKQTIEIINTSESRGAQGSFTKSYQSLGRELMTPDEIQRMKRRYCLLLITGLPPFCSRKYDLTKHPNYHLLKDANDANSFDISRRDLIAAADFLSAVSSVEQLDCSELNFLI